MNSVALIGRLTANPTSHAGEKHDSATCSGRPPIRVAAPSIGGVRAEGEARLVRSEDPQFGRSLLRRMRQLTTGPGL